MGNKYYKSFDFYNMKSGGGLHIISHFETMLQTTDFTCAPVCAIMVLNHLGITPPAELEMAKLCNTQFSKPCGTRLIDLLGALRKIVGLEIVSTYDLKNKNGVCFEKYEDFKNFAIKSIDNGAPIIVENCDYGGHYRVLIGFDEVNSKNPEEDILIFADPSDLNDGEKDGYTYVPADRFFLMWFDDHHMDSGAEKQAFIQILPKKK